MIRNTRTNEEGRHIFRSISLLMLLIINMAVFHLVWKYAYNPFFRNPYHFKGNFFAMFVYGALYLLFCKLYGGNKIGYYRAFKISYNLCITAFITNIVSYIAIIIPAATWYLSPLWACLYMTLIDAGIAIIYGVLVSRLFKKIFPPYNLLLISEKNTDEIEAKFALRPDRYVIGRAVNIKGEINGEILSLCNEYDGVIIGDMDAHKRNDVLKYCYSKGIKIYTLPKISDIILKSADELEVFDSPLLFNRNSGLSFEEKFIKRLSDILISVIGIVITSPIMLIIAILIKKEDGGPVLFRQKRVTRGGRTFNILKFRSMIVGAEKGESIPCTEDDPRITKVGKFIRKCRLDELPQLFNILKGDMSVVGPRPERLEHVEAYMGKIPEFSYRLSVKGGLTGYAQIYGKYNTSAYDKLKLDLIYIQNYSFFLDIEIILKTIEVLFVKESTEGFSKEKSENMREESHR